MQSNVGKRRYPYFLSFLGIHGDLEIAGPVSSSFKVDVLTGRKIVAPFEQAKRTPPETAMV